VKHSLLIHLKLLLSSLLTSLQKKEETLYRWKNPSGDGSVWKRFGDKQTQPRYEGEIKREYILFGDYILEGLGSLIYPLDDVKRDISYIGNEGSKYVGSWKDGKQNGQGTKTWSNGNTYVGSWKDGKEHGQGTHTYGKGIPPDKPHSEDLEGHKTVGEWKNGKLWNGTYYNECGTIYGKYVNGNVEYIPPPNLSNEELIKRTNKQ